MVGNILQVTVLNGRDLKCKDTTKEVTPYCLLQLGSTNHETRYITSTANPEWNEDFMFDVQQGYEVLTFSIWHKNTMKDDVVIGHAFVDFGSCRQGETITVTVRLMGIFSGEINLVVIPHYETTASKIERMERTITSLNYDATQYQDKIDDLYGQMTDLCENNEKLTKVNVLLEKHKRTMLGILSSVFDSERNSNEIDVKTAAIRHTNKAEISRSANLVTDSSGLNANREKLTANNDKLNGMRLGETIGRNDWEKHFTENIKILEEQLQRLGGKNKEDLKQANENMCNRDEPRSGDSEAEQRSGDSEGERTMTTHVENLNNESRELSRGNNDLNVLLTKMKLNREVQHDESILKKIIQISNRKKKNEAKMEVLKEVISDIDGDINSISKHVCVNGDDIKEDSLSENEAAVEVSAINANIKNKNIKNENLGKKITVEEEEGHADGQGFILVSTLEICPIHGIAGTKTIYDKKTRDSGFVDSGSNTFPKVSTPGITASRRRSSDPCCNLQEVISELDGNANKKTVKFSEHVVQINGGSDEISV